MNAQYGETEDIVARKFLYNMTSGLYILMHFDGGQKLSIS